MVSRQGSRIPWRTAGSRGTQLQVLQRSQGKLRGSIQVPLPHLQRARQLQPGIVLISTSGSSSISNKPAPRTRIWTIPWRVQGLLALLVPLVRTSSAVVPRQDGAGPLQTWGPLLISRAFPCPGDQILRKIQDMGTKLSPVKASHEKREESHTRTASVLG